MDGVREAEREEERRWSEAGVIVREEGRWLPFANLDQCTTME